VPAGPGRRDCALCGERCHREIAAFTVGVLPHVRISGLQIGAIASLAGSPIFRLRRVSESAGGKRTLHSN
jgi:hypothetical protein